MIVVDANVLAYATGGEHPLREPCRALLQRISSGAIEATTTVAAIHEFVHVHARRRTRAAAASLGRDFAALLAPLVSEAPDAVSASLDLYERHGRLNTFDALLAAAAISHGAEALVSADRDFGGVPGLTWIEPGTPAFDALLG